MQKLYKYLNSIYSTTSNYDEDVDAESSVTIADDGAGVQHVENFANQEEAVQIDDGGAGGGPKASTSGTSENRKVGPSTLHIQKPRAIRMSEAAKQRQQVTTSFIELLQKEQERDLKEDDEIDAMFAACGTRMRKHLNDNQREDVLQEITRVVNEAINNVRAGLPAVMTARNMYAPPMMPAPQITMPVRPPVQQQQQVNEQQLPNMQNSTQPQAMYQQYSYTEL